MHIVSNQNGKIIIGGFIPSKGYPESVANDFPFREIAYAEDPKVNSKAIPAALFYKYGDTITRAELMQILKVAKTH